MSKQRTLTRLAEPWQEKINIALEARRQGQLAREGKPLTFRSRRLQRVALALWMVATLVLVVATVTSAGAQNPGDPALLITDYAGYPDATDTGAELACDAGDILLDQDGAGFSLNGGPLQPTLAALGPLESGDVVTATFVATEDCQGSVVSLTIKNSTQDSFDPTTNQVNVGYEAVVAGEGLSTVELTLPALDEDCFYQLDHVVGYPLAVVGPSGSFYNPANRGGVGRNMLVDARNGTLTSCDEGTTTTTTGSTTSTTTGSTTSTSQSTTTTSQPSTTTTAPTTSTTAPTATTSRPSTTVVVTSPQGQTATSAGRIPQTGASDWLPLLAAVLVVAGVVAEGGAVWAKRNGRAL